MLHSYKLHENVQGMSKWHKQGTPQALQAKSIIHGDDEECHKL
jgi:hypothetical protein